MSTLQVRGSALWGRKEWVRRHHGAEVLQSLRADLSPAGRNLLYDDIQRTEWYNFPLFIEWCEVLDRRFGSGDGRLNVEMSRFSAIENTPRLYHMFIRLGSIDWVLARAEKLWRENFNAGAVSIHRDGDRLAEAEILDWPSPHITHTYSVLGFAIGVLELSGARDVRGQIVSCRSLGGDRTSLRCTWTA
jgi:hypothetical protein